MLILLLISLIRSVNMLPLGPALLFIGWNIQISGAPVYFAIAFPSLILMMLILDLIWKHRAPLPPLVSLAGATLYLTRLSQDRLGNDVPFMILAFLLVVAVHAYRFLISSRAQNVRIHIIEDLVVYLLILAFLRMYGEFSSLRVYTILVIIYLVTALNHFVTRAHTQFISAGVVATLGLIPIVELQLPIVTNVGDFGAQGGSLLFGWNVSCSLFSSFSNAHSESFRKAYVYSIDGNSIFCTGALIRPAS